MKKQLTPPERLIVAADFSPANRNSDLVLLNGRQWVRKKVLDLADLLQGTGVYFKVNSALRACGDDLIREIHDRGLRVFTDYKLADIGETLKTDGAFLRESAPELLTVFCPTGPTAMQALKKELPDTEVLGVTILTSLTDAEAGQIFKFPTVMENVLNLARIASEVGMDGIVCSPKEAAAVRACIRPEMTINTPAIRMKWTFVPGDDQNPDRVMTPTTAIQAGVTRLVLGRPILNHKNPRDAVLMTIDEIAAAMGQ